MLEKVIENWTSRLDYIRASRGSPMPEIIFKIVSSSNSPVVLSPSTRRLLVMNDCPRLERKKNDNSPVVLSTSTHRLLVTNGCPRLKVRKKTMSGAS
ncbi:hypothetical protein TNCV_3915721 [Trichonephila clavipes]|nr:hypothetical protein TNCV_3915721 [Trichonephila clavipes]